MQYTQFPLANRRFLAFGFLLPPVPGLVAVAGAIAAVGAALEAGVSRLPKRRARGI